MNAERRARFDVRRRNVTACNRCKKRKQKCDQKLPTCSNCERAGAECESYDPVAGRTAPRSYLQHLEDRVAFLEMRLQAHGISIQDTLDSEVAGSIAMDDAAVSLLPRPSSVAPISAPPPPPPPPPGAASEFWLLHLMLPKLGIPMPSTGEPGGTDAARLEEEMFPPTAVSQLPPLATAQRLSQTFFEHCDWFLPVLHRPQFLVDMDEIHARSHTTVPEGAELKYFTYFMVMAIALLLLAKTDASTPTTSSERFLMSAMDVVRDRPQAIFTNDLGQMEAMTLLAQYTSLHPTPSGAWQTIGIAVRLALHLGLHEEPSLQHHHRSFSDRTDDHLYLERRRRLFWAAYSLELNICIALGRSPSIPRQSITARHPTEVDDANVTKDGILPQDGPSKKRAAIWVLRCRQLEAEIQNVLHLATPHGYQVADVSEWRSDMAARLHGLYAERPQLTSSTRLEPMDIFEGFYCNALVYLYLPTRKFPAVASPDAVVLAKAAIQSIGVYRQGFRDATFRFYWRTTLRLFRAGTGLLYCMSHVPEIKAEIGSDELHAAINTCSAVLWGMVERYPHGRVYRDAFDQMVKDMTLRANASPASVSEEASRAHTRSDIVLHNPEPSYTWSGLTPFEYVLDQAVDFADYPFFSESPSDPISMTDFGSYV